MAEVAARLDDPVRLAAAQASGLHDGPLSTIDALAHWLQRSAGVWRVMVTVVLPDRQVVVAGAAPQDSPNPAETPLSQSFCKHVVTTGRRLVVPDARHPLVACHAAAVSGLGVEAYAGLPLRTPAGEVLGAVCFLQDEARAWSDIDLDLLGCLASAAEAEVVTRLASHTAPPRLTREQLVTAHHELRTPLTAVLGFLEVLEEGAAGQLTEPQYAIVDRCLRSGWRLGRSIDLLLGQVEEVAAPDSTLSSCLIEPGRSGKDPEWLQGADHLPAIVVPDSRSGHRPAPGPQGFATVSRSLTAGPPLSARNDGTRPVKTFGTDAWTTTSSSGRDRG